MKFKTNSDSTRNTAAPAANHPASVPISVYRELAAELQATRAMVDSLNLRNQQLAQDNYTLRQEMERVVHSALTLQQWINPPHASTDPGCEQPGVSGTPPRPSIEETVSAAAIAAKLREPASNPWLTEEAAPPQRLSHTKPARFGGLWLTLTVVAIIVTAFGAGFLVMRPFLPTANR